MGAIGVERIAGSKDGDHHRSGTVVECASRRGHAYGLVALPGRGVRTCVGDACGQGGRD